MGPCENRAATELVENTYFEYNFEKTFLPGKEDMEALVEKRCKILGRMTTIVSTKRKAEMAIHHLRRL